MTPFSAHPLIRTRSGLSSRARRGAAVSAIAAIAVLGTATSAQAHVGVSPDSTVAGHGSQLTFRVPDESETASTVKLVVTLPQDRPFTDLSTRPMPGWTATVTEAPLPRPVMVGGATITRAPHTVTWVAVPGTNIAPGEYQEFAFATDALPAAGEMVLPVSQFYSDGSVVRWTEPITPGKAEPEHPAPVFTVTTATTAGPSSEAAPAAAAGITTSAQAAGAVAPGATARTGSSTDTTARALGGTALVVTLAAGALALPRRRSTGHLS